jgi:hypothetical protein
MVELILEMVKKNVTPTLCQLLCQNFNYLKINGFVKILKMST